MLTFESASSLGVNSIVEKLTVRTPIENAQKSVRRLQSTY